MVEPSKTLSSIQIQEQGKIQFEKLLADVEQQGMMNPKAAIQKLSWLILYQQQQIETLARQFRLATGNFEAFYSFPPKGDLTNDIEL